MIPRRLDTENMNYDMLRNICIYSLKLQREECNALQIQDAEYICKSQAKRL